MQNIDSEINISNVIFNTMASFFLDQDRRYPTLQIDSRYVVHVLACEDGSLNHYHRMLLGDFESQARESVISKLGKPIILHLQCL